MSGAVDSPFGFVPIGTTDGSDYHGKMRDVEGDGSADLFLGDMLVYAGGGSTDGDRQLVAAAGGVAAELLAGAVVSFTPNFTDEGSLLTNFLDSADQDGVPVKVVYGTRVIFMAQVTETLAATAVGQNAEISVATAGTEITGMSGQAIDGATEANTGTLPLRLLGLNRIESPNELADAFPIWNCRINTSSDADSTAGV